MLTPELFSGSGSVPPDLLPLQQNLHFKRLFANRGLDLAAVMAFTPHDLDLENQRLSDLVEFLKEYERYDDKAALRIIKGDRFIPPIFPSFSLEGDWNRFALWLAGEALKKPLRDMLHDPLPFPAPETLGDSELAFHTKRLLAAFEEVHIEVGVCEGMPARLFYTCLYEELQKIYDVEEEEGSMCVDGCDVCCPNCLQRPWCKEGQMFCYAEDEKAGKMQLHDALADYVSASSQSLALIKEAEKLFNSRFLPMTYAFMEERFGVEVAMKWLVERN